MWGVLFVNLLKNLPQLWHSLQKLGGFNKKYWQGEGADVVWVHNAEGVGVCFLCGKITFTIAIPFPAPNTQVSQNAKTYKAFEITPENLSQIQNAMGSVEAVKKLDGVTINKIGVVSKTVNGKTYVAIGLKVTAPNTVLDWFFCSSKPRSAYPWPSGAFFCLWGRTYKKSLEILDRFP